MVQKGFAFLGLLVVFQVTEFLRVIHRVTQRKGGLSGDIKPDRSSIRDPASARYLTPVECPGIRQVKIPECRPVRQILKMS